MQAGSAGDALLAVFVPNAMLMEKPEGRRRFMRSAQASSLRMPVDPTGPQNPGAWEALWGGWVNRHAIGKARRVEAIHVH